MQPIAIIGASCRFPGANGLEEFWQLLREGRNAVSKVPKDRWDPDLLFTGDLVSGDPESRVNTAIRHGAFLPNIREFDCAFFGISPREAAAMDPQQRLLLETAYEAFEDAGVPMESLAGSQTAVYVGIGPGDYGRMCAQPWEDITAHYVTGNFLSTAVDRIAYFFDLRGPSIAVDTACSSSLVSLHLACRSLESGEADLALAGGVNAVLAPTLSISLAKAGALSPSGQCRSFDAKADGYVRGEGSGFVVLKRLDEALKDGDRIYAVVRGTAVRQGGRRNGLTAPGGWSEEAVMKAAWQAAGIPPVTADYVEVQGTGTLLGDAIEASALGKVFGPRNGQGPCRIGTVKTNIGHLETAAGVAGLIKVALMISHGEFVPTLFSEQPNPHINTEKIGIAVQTRHEKWPLDGGQLRAAGVSSFGMGGTYAHVCLTGAETLPQVSQEGFTKPEGYLLPLSARHPEALRELVREMADRVENVDPPLLDLCRAAAVRRTHHEYRVAFAGLCADELLREMTSWLQQANSPAKASSKRKLVAVISDNENCDEDSARNEKRATSHLLQTLESWDIHLAHSFCLADGQALLSAEDSKPRISLPELKTSGADVLNLTGQHSLACAELSSTNGSTLRGFSSSEPSCLTPLRIAAQLYAIGYPIAWRKIYSGIVRQVSLPLYPWQHQVCWLESLDAGRRAVEKHDASSSQPTAPANRSLRDALSRITGLPERDIRLDASPSDLGIDSLLTLELQEQLRRFSGKLIPVETLVQVKTVRELDALLENQPEATASKLVPSTPPTTGAARPFEVREAVFTDYDKIAALILRNGLGVKTRREWEHVWRNNPVYQNRLGWPIGWVVEEGDQIAGFLGNIPLTYHFKGREILASGLHAFALDPSHRGLGLLLLNRLLEFAPEVEYFVGSTANLNSSKVLDRLGISRIPVGDWANSAFWITNYDGFARSAIAKKRWPGVLAGIASPALRAYDKIAKGPWPHQAHSLIRQIGFDERFDAFWLELRESNPNCFMAERSREVLNWHFKFSLEQNNAWIVTHESNSRVLAYAVFQRQDYDEINLKRVRLIDYQALPGAGDVLPSILSWGLNECRAQGIHMLEVFGFRPEKQRIIDRLAPHHRKFAAWTYFHKVASPALQRELQDLSAWDPSQYDGDASV